MAAEEDNENLDGDDDDGVDDFDDDEDSISQTGLTPEEKLIRAIFGNNAADAVDKRCAALRQAVKLHQTSKNYAKEIEAWEELRDLGRMSGTDLHSVGIAYYNHKNFAKALEYYRRYAAMHQDIAPLFNMGLVYNDPEVSQDADAADAYRRALALKPDYERAKEALESTKRKLVPLAQHARAAAVGLVQSEDRFRFYINPFEVLQIQAIESAEGLAVKVIQRAKKQLLQELELNDGKVSWLHNYPLDKSRAIAMEEELYDESMRRYHWAIFQDKPLLRFLTLGDCDAEGGSVYSTPALSVRAMKSPIEQFLYSDAYFPQDTIALLEKDPGFRSFIGKPFAQQYNFLLTRAIEKKIVPVIEVLFDGRRWVEPEHDNICFDGASRWAKQRIVWIEQQVEIAARKKPNVLEVEKYLVDNAVIEIFNLLPTWFRDDQSRFVAAIRVLAISCHNDHGDTASSDKLLRLSDGFKFKSVTLNKQLEEDRAKVKEILAERAKHSFSIYVRKDLPLTIDHNGVTYGSTTITPDELESVRWGVFIRYHNRIEGERIFELVLQSQAAVVPIKWDKRGLIRLTKSLFRKAGAIVPVAEMSSLEQQVVFTMAIDAVLYFLVPTLVDKLIDRLMHGQEFAIGPCTLSRSGIAFNTGTIFRKEHIIPWSGVSCQMGGGGVCVFGKHNAKVLPGKNSVSMSVMETDNAVLFPIILNIMEQQSAD